MARRAGSGRQEGRRSFEEEWPELSRRLERFLGARGVDRWLRADVVQETGARLYERWETLDRSLPLWNLAATIAVRIVHNHRRKESRIELVPDPVPMHGDDVDVRGLQRVQLDKTRAALQHLTDDQRRVLLAEVGEALLPGGSRNRVNVLRLRARARLREALGPWAPSAVALRLRFVRANIAHRRFALEAYVPAVVNSLVNVALTATLGFAGAAGPAAAAVPLAPERAPSLSLAELRAFASDPVAADERTGPSNRSRTEHGAAEKYDDAGAPETPEGLGDWAERRQEEVGNLADDGRNLADDGRNLADDGGRLAGDGRRVGEQWARGRQEEAGDRKEEVEDLLP